MPSIIFIHTDGARETRCTPVGTTIMDCAVDQAVNGIIGRCGGAPTCATCHCYVEQPWLARLPAPSADEAALLEYVFDPQANSRLACQITLGDDLDGITVRLPARQV